VDQPNSVAQFTIDFNTDSTTGPATLWVDLDGAVTEHSLGTNAGFQQNITTTGQHRLVLRATNGTYAGEWVVYVDLDTSAFTCEASVSQNVAPLSPGS
jgi:hypothetical protein